MKIRFVDIKPNPYRDLVSNPLREDKIEALIESIRETGFWDNVVVRKNAKGEYELAYGHHRVHAAIKAGLTEGNFIVRELSNDMMLAMMARENAEVYGNDLKSTVESVEALVRAYAEGALSLPEKLVPSKDTPKAHLRFAPSYVPGKVIPSSQCEERPYTAITVARFLGFTHREGTEADRNVVVSLNFLELKELKIGGIKTLDDLRTTPGTGPIPVFSALKMIKELKEKHNVTMERAKVRSAQVVEDGAAVQRKLAALQAEQKKAEAESEKLLAQQAEAMREKATKRAQEAKQSLEQQAKEAIERKALIERTKKEQRELDKQRAKSHKEDEARAQRESEQALARWNSKSKSLCDQVDRIMSTNDPLYDELLSWTRDKRVTDTQRSMLAKALVDLVSRITIFNPNPARPIAKKGERK